MCAVGWTHFALGGSACANLHLGVGFLAATSDLADDRGLRFGSFETRRGRISTYFAGGEVIRWSALHGLGGTKASFLPTVAALRRSPPGASRSTCRGSVTPTSP